MGKHPQARVARLRLGQPAGCRIAAAVVDIYDLELAVALERGMDFGEQRQDVLGFVAHRDDDR